MIFRRALIFAIAIPLLVPAAGFAHALFADHNPNRPVLEYVWIGFWHMVGGWDHLLFILGVVLIAGAIKPAAKLISLFVLGHSLTLIVATVAGWQVDATVVDVVIALSLVYVGVQGLMGRPDELPPDGRDRVRLRPRPRARALDPPAGPRAARERRRDPRDPVQHRRRDRPADRAGGHRRARHAGGAQAAAPARERALRLQRPDRRRHPRRAADGLPDFGEDEPAGTQVASTAEESSETCDVETATPPTALGGEHPAKAVLRPGRDRTGGEPHARHRRRPR